MSSSNAAVGCGAPAAAGSCAPQSGPACGANLQWLALVPCCRTAGVPPRGERAAVSEYKPDDFVGVETPRKLSRWVDDSSDEEEEQQQKPAEVPARQASPPATPEALRDLGGGW